MRWQTPDVNSVIFLFSSKPSMRWQTHVMPTPQGFQPSKPSMRWQTIEPQICTFP